MTVALGVLCSGTGTNLQAILDAIARGDLDARVAVVIANRTDAKAIARARASSVAAEIVSHRDYEGRELFDAALVERLRHHGAEWIVLAGFMRVVTAVLLRAFEGRVVNIHPALLPAFPGVDAQAQALAYGVKIAGCTTHFVDEGVDSGPIIGQRAVAVQADDTRDTLAARILVEEHALLVETIASIARGEIALDRSGSGRARVIRSRGPA